ncbi:MAG TPA: hypothetical protein VMY41_00460 [Thermohalobaculum sp.]|nr:hypothetical protein [Thermohalobaculum sp.]
MDPLPWQRAEAVKGAAPGHLAGADATVIDGLYPPTLILAQGVEKVDFATTPRSPSIADRPFIEPLPASPPLIGNRSPLVAGPGISSTVPSASITAPTRNTAAPAAASAACRSSA